MTRRAYVRVRPGSSVWEIEGEDTIRQVGTDKQTKYTVDRVFDAGQSNEVLYKETTLSLVRQVVEEGLNATVLAYGQTSSGKTHTMRGSEEDPGVIPRAVVDLFRSVQAVDPGSVDRKDELAVAVSYMEIYNEDIRDLLADAQTALAIGSKADGGVVVQGLSEHVVQSVDEVMALLDKGDANRRVGETKMNARSSRSHAIFRLAVGAQGGRGNVLTLVDLAGSERLGKTGAEGQRQKEGAAINKSLLVLGTVISKLSNAALGGARSGHVPYRDSKLTRVLQPALGGNSKTAIICAITPAAEQSDESHNSLMFACRAKTVLNEVKVGNDGALDEGVNEVGAVIDAEAVQRVVKRKVECVTSYMLFDNARGSCGNGGFRRQSWSGVGVDVKVEDNSHHKEKRSRRVTLAVPETLKNGSDWFGSFDDGAIEAARGSTTTDAMPVLERYKRELEAVQGELQREKQARGDILPALKEAEWKNRQLEKDLDAYKAEVDRYKTMALESHNPTPSGGADGDQESNRNGDDDAKKKEMELKYEAQLAELQACADAASAHVRYLEDKLVQESLEREAAIAELEARHNDKSLAMEKAMRDLEDTRERSKLEIDALLSESRALKDENDGLLKRIGMASGTLNALDELRDLKKKHREEVGKLNGQIRNLTVGSKGNERAAERAAKDTNRLKNQIQDLEMKLKKLVAEKSALQSEKAALDRELRATKASLEKINKTADRAAAAEERRRQPILNELEETKSKLGTAIEERQNAIFSAEEERGRAEALQQDLNASRAQATDLAASLQAERETTFELSRSLEEERAKAEKLSVAIEDRTRELQGTSLSLQEANKNVAKLNETVKGLKTNVEQAAAERAQLEASIEVLKQTNQSLEDSLEASEKKAEMLEGVQLDLDAERAQVAALQKNFGVMEKGLEDHKREVEALRKVIAEKEERASSLDVSMNALTSRAAELQAALEAAGTEIRKTKSLLSQAENAIEEHETTITEVFKEKLDLERALGELEKEAGVLREDRTSMVQEKAELADLIQTLQSDLLAARNALEHEILGNKAKLDDLMAAHESAQQLKQQELEEARSTQEKLELEARALRAEVLELKLDLEKIREDQMATAAAVAEREEAAVGAAQELRKSLEDQLREAQEMLETERTASKSAIDLMKESSSEAAKMAAAELADARERANALHRELQTLRGNALGLEEEIEALKASRESDSGHRAAMEDKLSAMQEELSQLKCLHKLELESAKAEVSKTASVDASGHAQLIKELEQFKERYAALEGELRKSKRREEKLHALQYRLQMDVRESGGCLGALNNLRSVRELEFDLDRAHNQISRLRAQVEKRDKGGGRTPLEPRTENVVSH